MCYFNWSMFYVRRRQWHPTPVLLPGKSHGWRSLVGCSPWGREESDTTWLEWLHFHFSLSCIGEGNGNPLQCYCLENPRDGEPGGLPSMGLHKVRHDWYDLAAATTWKLCPQKSFALSNWALFNKAPHGWFNSFENLPYLTLLLTIWLVPWHSEVLC